MLNRRNSILNNKGFSLIELMVVVAIIGILAAIGIPQYSKFQAKTRQSEAKGALASLFTAETSFRGEWNQFSVDLVNIGYGVSGTRLRYVTGFMSGALGVGAATACPGYSTTIGAPAEVANLTNVMSNGANVNIAGPNQATFQYILLPGAAAPAPATRTLAGTVPTTALAMCDAPAGTYLGIAIGDPNATAGAVPLDGWTINQAKAIANPTPGIR